PMNNAVLPEQIEKGIPNVFPPTSARPLGSIVRDTNQTPMSFGRNRRQGSNESFLAQVHDGHWVSVLPNPIGY
ncbi:MAG: hypothetical protein FWD12_01860, partial [Alphaproteobacteria bacterium]|nr:hypothetical protein [Alphaproteobacteria bacterium]